ncbi:hypothetical protein [Undibacterium fentianense]|uniref:Uncharacterized protein n=1 Tax=Undibacterium fentianense TaxID=2828728 RepID=A0A941ICR9_9BURK|nr:hypothetical protein [Undibacterium fentianense]MBR7800494.1 hypothetical protein [Undibacterium fentianense]
MSPSQTIGMLFVSTGILAGCANNIHPVAVSNDKLEIKKMTSCARPIGTIFIRESDALPSYRQIYNAAGNTSNYGHLESLVPLARAALQTRGCFTVIDAPKSNDWNNSQQASARYRLNIERAMLDDSGDFTTDELGRRKRVSLNPGISVTKALFGSRLITSVISVTITDSTTGTVYRGIGRASTQENYTSMPEVHELSTLAMGRIVPGDGDLLSAAMLFSIDRAVDEYRKTR